jgi:hypothetical protein
MHDLLGDIILIRQFCGHPIQLAIDLGGSLLTARSSKDNRAKPPTAQFATAAMPPALFDAAAVIGPPFLALCSLVL